MKRALYSIGVAVLCAGLVGTKAASEPATPPPTQRGGDAGVSGLRIRKPRALSSLSLPLQTSADGGLETNTVQLLTSYARYMGLKTRGEPISFAHAPTGNPDGGLDLRVELESLPAEAPVAAPFSIHVWEDATEAEAICTVDFSELSNCIEAVENSIEDAGYQQVAAARVESLAVDGNTGQYRVTVFAVLTMDGGTEGREDRP